MSGLTAFFHGVFDCLRVIVFEWVFHGFVERCQVIIRHLTYNCFLVSPSQSTRLLPPSEESRDSGISSLQTSSLWMRRQPSRNASMALGGPIEEEEAEESSHSSGAANGAVIDSSASASSNDSTDDSLLRELEALDCLSPDAASKAPSAFSQLMKAPLLHKPEDRLGSLPPPSRLPQKRQLFPGKESAASPKSKRRKAGTVLEQSHEQMQQQPEEQPRPSETQCPRSDSNLDLLPDGSGRRYRLPTIPGRHSDLKSISGSTLSDLLDGFYANVRFRVVDSRYPYEYEGGHVRAGDNFYGEDAVRQAFFFPGGRDADASDHASGDVVDVVIFHCEFSAERGPRMMRCLRNADRSFNACDYPKLRYPELYLLDGGYQRFFESFPRHCVPQNYVKMTDRNFAQDMKKFRRKAKSMNVGDEMAKAAGGRPGMKRSRSIKF